MIKTTKIKSTQTPITRVIDLTPQTDGRRQDFELSTEVHRPDEGYVLWKHGKYLNDTRHHYFSITDNGMRLHFYVAPAAGDELQLVVNDVVIDTQLATIDDVLEEAENRALADNELQNEIDDMKAATDVVDVVGTHVQLESYDKSKLTDKDVIKVLNDETQENSQTYYRFDISSKEFSLIGSLAPYYSKTETDNIVDEINTKIDTNVTRIDANIDDVEEDVAVLKDWAVKVLTEDMIDCKQGDNPDGIALWKLPDGLYFNRDNIYYYFSDNDGNAASALGHSKSSKFIEVRHNTNDYQIFVRNADYYSGIANNSFSYMVCGRVLGDERAIIDFQRKLDVTPKDSLTSTDTDVSLSANQGKVLNDKITTATNTLSQQISEEATVREGADEAINTTVQSNYEELSDKISETNTNLSTVSDEVSTLQDKVTNISAEVDKKITTPDGGTTGQVLKKTDSGTEWADGGSSSKFEGCLLWDFMNKKQYGQGGLSCQLEYQIRLQDSSGGCPVFIDNFIENATASVNQLYFYILSGVPMIKYPCTDGTWQMITSSDYTDYNSIVTQMVSWLRSGTGNVIMELNSSYYLNESLSDFIDESKLYQAVPHNGFNLYGVDLVWFGWHHKKQIELQNYFAETPVTNLRFDTTAGSLGTTLVLNDEGRNAVADALEANTDSIYALVRINELSNSVSPQAISNIASYDSTDEALNLTTNL